MTIEFERAIIGVFISRVIVFNNIYFLYFLLKKFNIEPCFELVFGGEIFFFLAVVLSDPSAIATSPTSLIDSTGGVSVSSSEHE